MNSWHKPVISQQVFVTAHIAIKIHNTIGAVEYPNTSMLIQSQKCL